MLDTIMPIVATIVVIMLFAIPGAWGGVFTFSLLGHLAQLLEKKKEVKVEIEGKK
ncbi:MAG: hypothetical protein ACI86H_000521 [bacterium]|jgi:hypothetical protein